jgi:hypothetical protein
MLDTLRRAPGVLFRVLMPIHWISWEVSVVPFKAIGNADSEQKRNSLIEAWVKTMSHQLSNVMVTVWRIDSRDPCLEIILTSSRAPSCLV